MAASIQTTTNGALRPQNGITKAEPPSTDLKASSNRPSPMSYIDRAIHSTTSTAAGVANYTADRSVQLLNQVASPQQRDALIEQLQSFVLANPQLSAFIGINLLLTGVPLLLFIGFSFATFFFSLVLGLLAGLIGAILFTCSAVGIALAILLPTILFTTTAATSLFLWGLAVFYIVRRFKGATKAQRKQ